MKLITIKYHISLLLFISNFITSAHSQSFTTSALSDRNYFYLIFSILLLLIIALIIYIYALRKRLYLKKNLYNTFTQQKPSLEKSYQTIDAVDDIEKIDHFFFVASDLLCVMDLNGTFRRVNKQWEIVLGYSDKTLISTLFFDYIHEKDLTTAKEFIASLEKNSAIANFISRFKATDNSYKWLEWRLTRIANMIYAVARDITERKRDEDTLRDLVQVTVKTPREGFFDSIINWLRLWLNADLCLLFEINENSTAHIISTSSKVNLPTIINNIDKEPLLLLTIKNKICHYSDNIDVICPESSIVQKYNVRGYAGITLYDKNGSIKGVLSILSQSTLMLPSMSNEVFQLIAIRTVSEMEYLQAEARYSSILNTAMDCFALIDITGRFIDVNEAYCRLVGLNKQELLEKTIGEIDVPNSNYTITQRLNHLNESVYDRFETQHRHCNGTLIDLEVSINCLPNEKGQFVMFLRNITERKKTETKINDITERFTLATHAASMGIWDWNIESNNLVWNDQMFNLYGKDSSENEITFDTWKKSLHPDDIERTLTEIDFALKGIKEFDTEFRIILPDNQVKYVRAISKVYKNNSGKPIRLIGTNWDISLEKETQKEFRNAIEQADKANRSKSEFIANMSHEIRTPLNAIIGFSELLESLSTNSKQKNYINSIIIAGRSLLRIINDILDISKIESGMMKAQCTPTELHPILEEIRQIFLPRLEEKGLKFNLKIDPFFQNILYIDEIRLRQVLLNIVGNSVKFTDSGYISICAEPLSKKDIENNTIDILIQIEDTGIGIPKDEQSLIFERFRQRSGQNSAKYGGTGLGLSISKKFTELMNGELSVKSDPGKGSTFILKLNDIRYVPSQKSIAKIKQSNSYDSIHFSRSKVLIADDIESNRMMIKEHLVNAGLDVLEVDNGLSAVKASEEHKPDIIIMDIRMPVMDGTTAMIAIRNKKSTKNIPIIALSAAANLKEIDHTSDYIFSEYLCKPIEKNQLMSVLVKYLPTTPIIKNKTKKVPEKSKISLEIRTLFKNNFQSKLNTFSGAIRIQSVRSLINELNLFTKEHFSKEINSLVIKLEKAVETFDFEKISSLLEKLNDLCD